MLAGYHMHIYIYVYIYTHNERCIIRRIEFYTGAVYKIILFYRMSGDDCNSDYDNNSNKKKKNKKV